jgi:ABC-2 type transport system ATP-binding protein
MVSGVSTTISVQDVRKSYGDLRAVDGVTFEVERGEFFGILGPNGAGKTTMLEIIEGLRRPDGGEVSVLGMTPWPRNPALLPRMGVQLQASSFFERLTAREQLRTFAALYGIPAGRADAMLEVVGLTDMAATRTEKLSGGQAQRLSIACALVHGPDVLFLDEPTGALDPQARRNLWDLLRAISAEGHTVVLTTHHMDEAETLCERVAIMDHGKILKIGSPAALVRELDQPVRISIEAGQLSLDEARALVHGAGRVSGNGAAGDPAAGDAAAADGAMVADDGVSLTIVTSEPAPVLAALADRRALAGLQVRGATLEDVFLHLTGREYRA